jgi:hypothetical protein
LLPKAVTLAVWFGYGAFAPWSRIVKRAGEFVALDAGRVGFAVGGFGVTRARRGLGRGRFRMRRRVADAVGSGGLFDDCSLAV